MKSKALKMLRLFSLLALILPFMNARATNKLSRLGVGYTNQFVHDIPALSFKLQKTRSFAYGAVLGLKSADSSGGLGAGLKLYRIIFEEPQLNFYGSLLGAYIKDKQSSTITYTGYQIDFTLGSEFHFQGLQSIGFSFEFGVSLNKGEESILQSVGNSLLVAGVHFYI